MDLPVEAGSRSGGEALHLPVGRNPDLAPADGVLPLQPIARRIRNELPLALEMKAIRGSARRPGGHAAGDVADIPIQGGGMRPVLG